MNNSSKMSEKMKKALLALKTSIELRKADNELNKIHRVQTKWGETHRSVELYFSEDDINNPRQKTTIIQVEFIEKGVYKKSIKVYDTPPFDIHVLSDEAIEEMYNDCLVESSEYYVNEENVIIEYAPDFVYKGTIK